MHDFKADEVNSEDLASVPEFLDDCSVFQEVEEDTVFEGQLRKMSRANVRRRKSTFVKFFNLYTLK